MAGARLPDDLDSLKPAGPRVAALLNACASQHAMIKMISEHGPLENYLLAGESPDYRSAEQKDAPPAPLRGSGRSRPVHGNW